MEKITKLVNLYLEIYEDSDYQDIGELLEDYGVATGEWVSVSEQECMMFEVVALNSGLGEYIVGTEIEYEDGKIVDYRGKK